ncbi:hypothetical protein Tco_1501474 [Tanacetum coccineum]
MGKEPLRTSLGDLMHIKQIVTKLPPSKRDGMQPSFSSLCAMADIVVKRIMDLVKILCDMKGSQLSGHFYELSTLPFGACFPTNTVVNNLLAELGMVMSNDLSFLARLF